MALGWPDDPTPMTLVSIGGQSVGVSIHDGDDEVRLVVGGVASGHVFGWPRYQVAGLRFSTRPDWAYLVDGTLVVREGTGFHVAMSRGSGDLQVVRLGDGAVVFALGGDLRLTAVTGPGAEDVELVSLRLGWIGLRPASIGPNFPTLTWADWDGQPHSLVLDEKL